MKEILETKRILMEIGEIVREKINMSKGYYLAEGFETYVKDKEFVLKIWEDTLHEPSSREIVVPFWVYKMYINGNKRMFNWLSTDCGAITFKDKRKTVYICETCDTPHLLTNEQRYELQYDWKCSYCGQRAW